MFVDMVYTKAFIAQYYNFVAGEGCLLDRKQILDMYDLMKELFPFVHSVIALTVSSPHSRGEKVDLSFFFDVNVEDNADTIHVGDVDNFTDDAYTNIEVEHEHEVLTKRERAILEFFIAKLRLRSQKRMRFWAMVPPLANHSWDTTNYPRTILFTEPGVP